MKNFSVNFYSAALSALSTEAELMQKRLCIINISDHTALLGLVGRTFGHISRRHGDQVDSCSAFRMVGNRLELNQDFADDIFDAIEESKSEIAAFGNAAVARNFRFDGNTYRVVVQMLDSSSFHLVSVYEHEYESFSKPYLFSNWGDPRYDTNSISSLIEDYTGVFKWMKYMEEQRWRVDFGSLCRIR